MYGRCVVLAAGLTLAGCGATTVVLPYTSSHPIATAPATGGIATVTVIDERKEDGHYVGTIRGGYGNPLKTIRTAETTADALRSAILAALAARGMSSPSGDTLAVAITRFDVNQMARREAHADFRYSLAGPAGQPIYQDSATAQDINGSLITFDKGVFASTDDLNALMDKAMSEAIDQMLDKPAFRAALVK